MKGMAGCDEGDHGVEPVVTVRGALKESDIPSLEQMAEALLA